MERDVFRHLVGKQTLAGRIVLKIREEGFFGPDPGSQGREIQLLFGIKQSAHARLQRFGRENRLKITFTGSSGAPFRRWLKQTFKPHGPRRPRGVLILKNVQSETFLAEAESLRTALVEELELGARHYFEGARPLSILHPALADLGALVSRIRVPGAAEPDTLREQIQGALCQAGWSVGGAVGGGLALQAGLRRARAELQLVLQAADLYTALVALAAGLHVHAIELGVLLVADGALAGRLRQPGGAPISTERALKDIGALPFLVRGPLEIISLSLRKTLR